MGPVILKLMDECQGERTRGKDATREDRWRCQGAGLARLPFKFLYLHIASCGWIAHEAPCRREEDRWPSGVRGFWETPAALAREQRLYPQFFV